MGTYLITTIVEAATEEEAVQVAAERCGRGDVDVHTLPSGDEIEE